MAMKVGRRPKTTKKVASKINEHVDKKNHVEGTEEKIHEKDEAILGDTLEGPTANVNVNVGARIGLPNYSDVRVGVSLTRPCEDNQKAIDRTFEEVQEWCFKRVDELTDKALED